MDTWYNNCNNVCWVTHNMVLIAITHPDVFLPADPDNPFHVAPAV